MKQQPTDGLAAAKSLYDFEESEKTKRKVANPTNNINLFSRPSLIPNVPYPTTDREEHLMDLAWKHAKELQRRGLL